MLQTDHDGLKFKTTQTEKERSLRQPKVCVCVTESVYVCVNSTSMFSMLLTSAIIKSHLFDSISHFNLRIQRVKKEQNQRERV